MLSLPRELDSDAFSQAQSDKGPPTRSVKASRIDSSKKLVACSICSGKQEGREKDILGSARHDRKRITSIRESSRSGNLANISLTYWRYPEAAVGLPHDY